MQTLVKKSATLSVFFGIIFFLLNYFSAKHDTISPLLIRTLLATLTFFVLYIIVFSIFNSDARKFKFGITLPISIVIFLIIGALFFTIQIGVIVGLIVGLIAGFIWEIIEKRNGGTH